MLKNRLYGVRKKINKIGLDAVWIIQPENRRYLSGFKARDGQLDESSGSLLITMNNALLLTDSRYTTQAQNEVKNFEVITIKEGLTNALPEIIERLNIKRLGFEGGYLTWDLYQKAKTEISKHSNPVEFIPLMGLVEDFREIKESEEINILRKSAKLMGDVLSQLIKELRPGQIERNIAWKIETLVYEQGAVKVAFSPIVASGPNSALPHAVPTSRAIKEHEPIIIDVGAMVDGYCSDMTRTVFLGEPQSYFKEIYHIVREAQLSAIQSIKAGMSCSEADSIARNVIKKAGFGDFFGHSLGHGIGLLTHERPFVGPKKQETLKEGMIFTVEPGIYIPKKGGIRLEEMVLLGKDGLEVITKNEDFFDF